MVQTLVLSSPAVMSTQPSRRQTAEIEVSVVIPCLNEAETLATCIRKAQRAMREHDIAGEIVVADNGSTDGSPDIAAALDARVVHVAQRGYGSSLMAGIAAAQGRYVVMGDADDSYDFGEVPRFVRKLREGYDLVQGCRLSRGGGRVLPDAMPPLHRWIGNPFFSWMARWMFQAPINDIYCGLRGFCKCSYDQLGLRCTGMEFATEMIIKASLVGQQFAELPITLHPDGRKSRAPHLRTFRDGWRTLRFLLMSSPRWLFLIPGLLLILLGLAGYGLAMPGVTILGAKLDAHTLLFASLAILLGYQSVQFAVFAKTFAAAEGILPPDARLRRFLSVATLERGLVAGTGGLLAGLALLATAVWKWEAAPFGSLDYPSTMRLVIPGVTLAALGFQTILSSCLVSILNVARR